MTERLELTEARPLGAYDCLINALLLWMQHNQASTLSLTLFNWDFHTSATKPFLFGGTVSMDAIAPFLLDRQGIHIAELTSEPPVEELFIMAMDAYDLPYIEAFYGKKRQPHFVVARRSAQDGDYEVFDAFYRIRTMVAAETAEQGMAASGKPGYRLSSLQTARASGLVYPHMLEKDFVSVYNRVQVWLSAQWLTFQSIGGKLKESDAFQKAFSCLRGVTLARERYFEALRAVAGSCEEMAKQGENIVGKWVAVEKNMIRMTFDVVSGYSRLVDSLSRAVEGEIVFLQTMKTMKRERCL